MKSKFISLFFVAFLFIVITIPAFLSHPSQQVDAAPTETPTAIVRLLPTSVQNSAEARSTLSVREERHTPPATPLTTPIATPAPPPVIVATPAPVVQVAPPAPVIVPPPAPPVQAPVLGTAWPVPGGEISQLFSGGHPALDIYADCNSTVVSAFGGTVTQSGWKDNGGGNVVTVATDLGIMEYNHLNSVSVSAGQFVGTGQIIGYVGATGWATGCHLHFALLRNGIWIDPLTVL